MVNSAPPKRVLEVVKKCIEELEEIDKGEDLEKENIDLNLVKKRIEDIRPFMNILTSKWIPEILYALTLRNGMSFNELKNTLGISSRVLSDKLKELQDLGMVEREASERGKKSKYKLTEKGKRIVYALTPFIIAIYLNKE